MGNGLRFAVVGACALSLALPLAAQDLSVRPEIRVTSRPYFPHTRQFTAQVNLVQARVVVRDVHEKPIAGLSASDFSLFVDGKPESIGKFSVETAPSAVSADHAGSRLGSARLSRVAAPPAAAPRPRYVALFMDDLSLDRVALGMARNAARKLKAADLGGNIRLGIFTSSGALTLNFTADSAAWGRTLSKLEYRARMPRDGIISGTSLSPELAYWVQQTPSKLSPFTRLGEARMAKASLCVSADSCHGVLLAEADSTVQIAEDTTSDILDALRRAIAALAAQPGDRVLLLTSTGFFADTMAPDLQDVAERALRDGVVIDSLDADLLETDPPESSLFEHIVDSDTRSSFSAPLATLADDTGGTLFQNNNDLAGALRRMASEPEVAYTLGFSPAAMPFDGKFHSIKVKVAGVRHPLVQTRKGYFDPAPDEDLYRAASPASVDAAVLGPIRAAAFPFGLSAAWQNGALRVNVRMDPARLHFADCEDDRSCEDLVFTTAVFDRQGHFVTGKSGAMSLALTHDGYKRLAKTGLGANLSLRLPAGAYRLREVIQEGNRRGLVALDRLIRVGS